MNDRPDERQAVARGGLCATCRHAEIITSDRGSRFLMCGRSRDDARYLRYPPLPVVQCPGHQTIRVEYD